MMMMSANKGFIKLSATPNPLAHCYFPLDLSTLEPLQLLVRLTLYDAAVVPHAAAKRLLAVLVKSGATWMGVTHLCAVFCATAHAGNTQHIAAAKAKAAEVQLEMSRMSVRGYCKAAPIGKCAMPACCFAIVRIVATTACICLGAFQADYWELTVWKIFLVFNRHCGPDRHMLCTAQGQDIAGCFQNGNRMRHPRAEHTVCCWTLVAHSQAT